MRVYIRERLESLERLEKGGRLGCVERVRVSTADSAAKKRPLSY